MAPKIDVPVKTEADPILGRALQRIIIDVGPPAAVAIVFVEVRESGAVRELAPIQLGDGVPEEVLASLPVKAAERLRAADDRGDRATRLLSRIIKPGFVAEIVADLTENGEIDG